MGPLAKLKYLDAFPKVNELAMEDFFTRTYSGGVITIATSIFMLFLFLSEFGRYLSLERSNELSVDTTRGETIVINVDITFPKMPCGWVSLDAMDISGDIQLDVDHDVYRQRLSQSGQALREVERHRVGPETNLDLMHNSTTDCGSCYGAEDAKTKCCNTCDEVREAYRRKGWAITNSDTVSQCVKEGQVSSIKEQEGEGCHLWGSLRVNKVAGNFHIAPGKSFQQGHVHVHDLMPFHTTAFDLSHRIDKLSFGTDYPGLMNPLEGLTVRQSGAGNPEGLPGMFQYFLKVVPTVYTDAANRTTATNQYSVTEHFKPSDVVSGRNLPGVFFFYDLSPIKVMVTERRRSFLHFLTSVCAIVGGVFSVSGLLDACVYHGEKAVRKKMQLGKLN